TREKEERETWKPGGEGGRDPMAPFRSALELLDAALQGVALRFEPFDVARVGYPVLHPVGVRRGYPGFLEGATPRWLEVGAGTRRLESELGRVGRGGRACDDRRGQPWKLVEARPRCARCCDRRLSGLGVVAPRVG